MGNMVSMMMDDEEIGDAPTPIAMPDKPDYPYGLCITLTNTELDKLGLDVTEATIGGVFHIEGLARITSLSMNDGPNGSCCRLEAQIEDLGVITSDADQADTPPPRASRLYKTQ